MTKKDIYKLDFVIQSKLLTEKQEKELSVFIAKRKLEIKKKSRKVTYTQTANIIPTTAGISYNQINPPILSRSLI